MAGVEADCTTVAKCAPEPEGEPSRILNQDSEVPVRPAWWDSVLLTCDRHRNGPALLAPILRRPTPIGGSDKSFVA